MEYSILHKAITLRVTSFVFLLGIFLSVGLSVNAQQWTLSKEKEGILVYTAESGSSYKMFKAEMTVETNLHGPVYLLKDANSVPKWMENIGEFELFGETDAFHWYSWTGIDMPWPVDNRDVVSKQVLRKIKNGYIMDISSTPDEMDNREGYVRLRVSEGFWSFERLPNGKVRVIYQVSAEPTGIPPWIVNLFIVDSPYQTLLNMREMVKKEPYKSIRLSYLN